MNNDELLFFEAHDAAIAMVLSDNGRDFFVRPERCPYEMFLQLEGIEHRTTGVKRPQSSCFVERLHHTLLDKHFRVMGHKRFYEAATRCRPTWRPFSRPTTMTGRTRAAA